MSFEEITTGFEGIYEVSEAARYLLIDTRQPDTRYKVGTRHLIRWIHKGLSHPSLMHIPGRQLLLTFEDLVSMRVIAFLRARNYSFTRIHEAEAIIRETTGHPRPFATDDIWADKGGSSDIFTDLASALLVATRHGQIAFKQIIQEYLISTHGLTFDHRGVAVKWIPRSDILLDPLIQFGRPCLAGTRIPTASIIGMIDAGDTVEFLAKSYQISPRRIEKAIAWEQELAAASAKPALLHS